MRKAWTVLILAALAAPALYTLLRPSDADTGAGKTNITYMAWGYPSQLATEHDLIEAFHRENPDIHVNFIMAPMQSYYDKVQIMFASSTAPDVLRVNPQHFAAYASLGYLRDLDPLMAADSSYNPDDFFPVARDAGLSGGRHYALGVLFTKTLIYYNKTLFREAGVEEPWDSYLAGRWTWQTLLAAAMQLTKEGSNGVPEHFGMSFPGSTDNVGSIIRDWGGKVLSDDGKRCLLDSPEAIAAVTFTRDLSRKWHAAPSPEQGTLQLFSFESGRLAMELDSSGESPRLRDAIQDFEWDVAPTPRGPGGEVTSYGAHRLVMNARTREPDAAWRFMTFITGRTAETLLGVKLRRCIPTRKEIAMSEAYLSSGGLPPFNMGAFVAGIDAPPVPEPFDDKANEWTAEFRSRLEQVWLGTKEPEEAMKEAAARINEILERP